MRDRIHQMLFITDALESFFMSVSCLLIYRLLYIPCRVLLLDLQVQDNAVHSAYEHVKPSNRNILYDIIIIIALYVALLRGTENALYEVYIEQGG